MKPETQQEWRITLECSVGHWYTRADVEKITAELADRIDGHRMVVGEGLTTHHEFKRSEIRREGKP